MQGASLSLVQSVAVEMLYLLDQKSKGSEKVDNLRLAIAGNHPERLRAIFPEWFPKSNTEAFKEAIRPDGTVDPDKVDESQIEWDVPKTKEEKDRLERWIAEHSKGQVRNTTLERRKR